MFIPERQLCLLFHSNLSCVFFVCGCEFLDQTLIRSQPSDQPSACSQLRLVCARSLARSALRRLKRIFPPGLMFHRINLKQNEHRKLSSTLRLLCQLDKLSHQTIKLDRRVVRHLGIFTRTFLRCRLPAVLLIDEIIFALGT